MESSVPKEPASEMHVCPECGTEETGYFCRICGALLYGEDNVLCPRCHHIVPDGEFCNQCGQSLGALALQLKQLQMAGDSFWVTSEDAASAIPEQVDLFSPDESVTLAAGSIPDWLEELNAVSAQPKAEERIYPALRPIQHKRTGGRSNLFMILVIVMFVIMLGLVALTVVAALISGG